MSRMALSKTKNKKNKLQAIGLKLMEIGCGGRI